jgi:ABC-type multidrug transport system fused ATPase/permease subunit
VASALRSDLRTIFACLSRARRRELALLTLLMPATALAETLTVAAVVPFIALLSGQSVGPTLGKFADTLLAIGINRPLVAAALLFALVVTVTAILRLALSWLSRHFAFVLGHEVSTEIQRRLLGQPYAYHLRTHSSEHLATLDKVDLLVFDLVIQGVQAISAILIGAFILALLVAIDPLNSLVAILMIGGFYAIALVATRNRLQRHGAVINSAYEQRARFVQEAIGSIRDIILDHSQAATLDRFRAMDAAFAQARTKTAFLAVTPRYLIEAVGLIVIALLAIVIAGRSGGITAALPFFGALALGALRLLPLLSQLYGAWASMAVVEPILTDLAVLLRLPMADVSTVPDRIEFRRSIDVKTVSFGYPDRVHHAIEDVALTIPKGARAAITGRTGSGKSTLADLLMGLIEPSRGSILVDGIPLSQDRLPGWQRSIAHVPQEIFLADDSIAANIALSSHGGEADRLRISSAARHAQLHDFIESLPRGYETRIGERGVRLSGGQKQRLALARALYKQAPVLVLDEPTSALDDQTEAAIVAALDELQSSGTTIIIVAHRLSTIAKCDPVLVLEAGRLVKSGSYAAIFGEPSSFDKAS